MICPTCDQTLQTLQTTCLLFGSFNLKHLVIILLFAFSFLKLLDLSFCLLLGFLRRIHIFFHMTISRKLLFFSLPLHFPKRFLLVSSIVIKEKERRAILKKRCPRSRRNRCLYDSPYNNSLPISFSIPQLPVCISEIIIPHSFLEIKVMVVVFLLNSSSLRKRSKRTFLGRTLNLNLKRINFSSLLIIIQLNNFPCFCIHIGNSIELLELNPNLFVDQSRFTVRSHLLSSRELISINLLFSTLQMRHWDYLRSLIIICLRLRIAVIKEKIPANNERCTSLYLQAVLK